jgi:rod shape-determining protein MreC
MTLIMLNLPSQTTARLKAGVGSLFLPLFGLTSSSERLAEQAGDSVVSRKELLRQNEALRRENQQFRLQLMQAEQMGRENDRLRQLFGWQQQRRWQLKLARVVLRDPANWWRTVQIDLGSRDGLRVNMPVLTTAGLAGRIASVSLTHSQVVLVGDPNCRVSAVVQNSTRDIGVIVPSGPLDPGLVAMGYLPPNANIKPGQTVVTSGDGGVYPKDIPIGTIVDAHPADYGLSTEARVRLAANVGALEEVWVLLQ